ncbi:hypothetical protein REPUB_Repub09cG0131000 [Reevesia pubescens]
MKSKRFGAMLLAFFYSSSKLTKVGEEKKRQVDVDFKEDAQRNWFLGGVPCLERLIGHIYFTKYLSIGDDPRRLPITYNHLKVVESYQVSFEDIKEILVVLRLITNSPNLKEL